MLNSQLSDFHVELHAVQKEKLARYCVELEKWNQKINLTGLNSVEIARRLVIEPVWVANELNFTGTLIDIGSGNGSPAIPIRVVSKFARLHLVEARAKRAAFLRHVVAALELTEVEIHRARFAKGFPQPGPVDWVTLQAVALTTELLDDIRSIGNSTTKVVWITSQNVVPPIESFRRLKIPTTDTEVLIFRLDQS